MDIRKCPECETGTLHKREENSLIMPSLPVQFPLGLNPFSCNDCKFQSQIDVQKNLCPKCKTGTLQDQEEKFPLMAHRHQPDHHSPFDRHMFSCDTCKFQSLINVGTGFGLHAKYESEDFEPTSSYHEDAIELLNLISTTQNANKSMLNKPTPEAQFLIRILYATAITALETYLSDALRYHVYNKDKYLLEFIRNYPFKENKVELTSLAGDGTKFDKTLKEYLKDRAKEEINEIIFHNLPRVAGIFSSTFKIPFPENWRELIPAVNRRHDIFHRGGKSHEGSQEKLTLQDLIEITQKVSEFIDTLNKEFEDREIKDQNSDRNKGD